MSILPTWPIAAGALVIGIAGGAFIDYKIMQSRIDQINIEHAEGLRVREVKRADDERAARSKEQEWNFKLNEVEQRRIDENERLRTIAASAVASVQQRPNRQPAPASGSSTPATTCKAATGAELSRPDAEFLIRFAERADQQREALSACYQSYDSIGR